MEVISKYKMKFYFENERAIFTVLLLNVSIIFVIYHGTVY